MNKAMKKKNCSPIRTKLWYLVFANRNPVRQHKSSLWSLNNLFVPSFEIWTLRRAFCFGRSGPDPAGQSLIRLKNNTLNAKYTLDFNVISLTDNPIFRTFRAFKPNLAKNPVDERAPFFFLESSFWSQTINSKSTTAQIYYIIPFDSLFDCAR